MSGPYWNPDTGRYETKEERDARLATLDAKDKRIAELEKENTNLHHQINDFIGSLAEKDALQEENERLRGEEKYHEHTVNRRLNLLWTIGEAAGFPHAQYGSVLNESELVLEVQKVLEQRTLTLSNGTVVKRGDVLVRYLRAYKTHVVALVTGVGKKTFLWRELGSIYMDEELTKASQDVESRNNHRNWKPWSEVYPDRPVPGEEQ